MVKTTEFSRPPAELSCIIGNLFLCLEPPCDEDLTAGGLVICGYTLSGDSGRLIIEKERCIFTGNEDDFLAALSRPCIERSCQNG